jgi:hypothetical protein
MRVHAQTASEHKVTQKLIIPNRSRSSCTYRVQHRQVLNLIGGSGGCVSPSALGETRQRMAASGRSDVRLFYAFRSWWVPLSDQKAEVE